MSATDGGTARKDAWMRGGRAWGRRLLGPLGLAVVLAVFDAAPAGAATVSITSTPANDTHYVAGGAITTKITGFPHVIESNAIWGVAGGAFNTSAMNINIGGTNDRHASPAATAASLPYTVTADDFDADSITFWPTRSLTPRGDRGIPPSAPTATISP